MITSGAGRREGCSMVASPSSGRGAGKEGAWRGEEGDPGRRLAGQNLLQVVWCISTDAYKHTCTTITHMHHNEAEDGLGNNRVASATPDNHFERGEAAGRQGGRGAARHIHGRAYRRKPRGLRYPITRSCAGTG